MYIWVILATFMVAIYSFNLSFRSDMKDIYATARIEPTITKLVAQHEAAEKFIRANTPGMPPYGNGQTQVTYIPGELNFSDVESFLPYGFKDHMTSGQYRSIIYCLDKNDTTGSKLPTGCNPASPTNSCCQGGNVHAFLITFGCVPQKFRNPYTNKYSVDFLKTLRSVSGYGSDVGYTEYLSITEQSSKDNDFESNMAIRTKNFEIISIPNYIVRNDMANTVSSFSRTCGDLKVGEDGEPDPNSCNSCLAQLSRL